MTAPAELALFGGRPLFERPRTTGQLANRDPQRFLALAAQVWSRPPADGDGPLVRQLEDELRAWHGSAHCLCFANACYALLLLFKATARVPDGEVVLPALTFRGLPHLIRWAGLQPVYGDVDPQRHTLAPASVAEHLGPRTAAVLAVDNVNALCEIDALEAQANAAGVPLLLDCVYAVGGHYERGAVGTRGLASVFSLHATKLINGFEGGYLTTDDAALADDLRRLRAGLPATAGRAHTPALDTRLNELHAAMALSNLPHRQAIIDDNAQRLRHYQRVFADLPWVSFADYRQAPGNDGLVLLRIEPHAPLGRDALLRLLRAERALVRPYYAPPLHRVLPESPTPTRDPHRALPVAEALSRQFIQMPVGDGMSLADIDRLRDWFDRIDRDAGRIADRLRQDSP